jgi:putative endonuclease
MGEIDIVACRGKSLLFIEVKARPSAIEASEAVSPRQRERIQRAATHFLSRNPRFIDFYQRFDVRFVLPWRWPVHIPDAWP